MYMMMLDIYWNKKIILHTNPAAAVITLWLGSTEIIRMIIDLFVKFIGTYHIIRLFRMETDMKLYLQNGTSKKVDCNL